jgi:hypothetical protein
MMRIPSSVILVALSSLPALLARHEKFITRSHTQNAGSATAAAFGRQQGAKHTITDVVLDGPTGAADTSVTAATPVSAVTAPKPDFTDCGWGTNNCAPEWVSLPKQEKYRYLGQSWGTIPQIVTRSDQEIVPRIVHFVLTDRATRYFDWTCWLAVQVEL